MHQHLFTLAALMQLLLKSLCQPLLIQLWHMLAHPPATHLRFLVERQLKHPGDWQYSSWHGRCSLQSPSCNLSDSVNKRPQTFPNSYPARALSSNTTKWCMLHSHLCFAWLEMIWTKNSLWQPWIWWWSDFKNIYCNLCWPLSRSIDLHDRHVYIPNVKTYFENIW